MGNTLALLIAGWMTAHSYPVPLKNALLHRMNVESRFNPNVVAGTGSSCLMQWVATRREALFRYAGTHACPSWEKQIEFMDRELRSEPAFRVLWTVSERNAYGMVTSVYSRPARTYGLVYGHRHRRRYW